MKQRKKIVVEVGNLNVKNRRKVMKIMTNNLKKEGIKINKLTIVVTENY